MSELLIIDETAAPIRTRDRTTYDTLRGGRLPGAAKITGKWRIDGDELLAGNAQGGELAKADGGDRG